MAYKTEGAIVAIGLIPNPAALTLKLCNNPSENISQPLSREVKTGKPTFKTKKPNSSIALFK